MADGTIESDTVVDGADDDEDLLANFCSERAFYKESDVYLKAHIGIPIAILAIEINNFRFLHLWYGEERGKRYLKNVARCLLKCKSEFGGVAGFFGGSQFALCIPCGAEQIETLERRLDDCRVPKDCVSTFRPLMGIYHVHDGSSSSETMYSKAAFALDGLRTSYTKCAAEYSDNIAKKIEQENELIPDIQRGLSENEFVFFLQPKCDMRTGKILGAEALVRWYYKKLRYIPPDGFIPLLERLGLVLLIDQQMWEAVLAWQRRWIDAGHKPLPVSMNVSRIDMLSFDVATYIKSLAEKYKIPPHLVEIEITESAYAESDTLIVDTISTLKSAGFPMLMDDFGSGYSSLNMLRNINFDILKLDMKFLFDTDENTRKGINILESVVNMARLLDLPVIVEGVETATQVQLLRDMGCRYAQGYYYYKPMPLENYEKLISDEKNVDYSGYKGKHVDQIHLRELLEQTMVSDTILNDMIGAIAFYDVHDDIIEVERANEPFYRIFHFGSGNVVATDEARHRFHTPKEEQADFRALFEKAYNAKSSYAFGDFHFRLNDGKTYWTCLRVFFLHEQNGHRHYICSFVDISPLMKDGHS